MRIGVLTGGGDCPGLNAVIRAVVRKGEVVFGDEFAGFLDGWRGVIENRTMPLDVERCRGILPRGGTILGTSRTNPYKVDGGVSQALDTLRSERIDALVAIGGEDTLGVASRLSGEGVAVVGVPKTIDNDLSATEVTFGFHTAVQIAADAIDRLHTTAENRTTASSYARSWGVTPAGSPPTPASPAGANRDPRSRGALRYRPGVRQPARSATPRADSRRSWSWPRGPLPAEGTLTVASRQGSTSSGTCGSAASPTCWPRRSRSAPASRPAPPSSGTSSGAAPRPRSTGSWPPASAWPRSTAYTTEGSARWSPSRPARS